MSLLQWWSNREPSPDDQQYESCNKAYEFYSSDDYENTSSGDIKHYGDSVEDIVVEFKKSKRNTNWYPYSELKLLKVYTKNKKEVFQISGPTLLLLDAIWFGEGLVKNNIKFSTLTIPNNRLDIISLVNKRVHYEIATNICIYHNPSINKQVEDILCHKTARDTARLILSFTQNTNCDICNMGRTNLAFPANSNSVARAMMSYVFLDNPVRQPILKKDHKYSVLDFCQEASFSLTPGRTIHNIPLNFNLKSYQLVWGIIDNEEGLSKIDKDYITNTTLLMNGHDRFNYNSYYTLIADKRSNGLRINNTYATHSFTFTNLYNSIDNTICASVDFSRLDSCVLRVTTKVIPPNTNAFIHVFAVGINELEYKDHEVSRVYAPFK